MQVLTEARGMRSSELGLQMVVNYLMWSLGLGLRSSGRVVCGLSVFKVFCLHVRLCNMCIPGAFGSLEGEFLELEL